jgi:hypothetical protein
VLYIKFDLILLIVIYYVLNLIIYFSILPVNIWFYLIFISNLVPILFIAICFLIPFLIDFFSTLKHLVSFYFYFKFGHRSLDFYLFFFMLFSDLFFLFLSINNILLIEDLAS